jgi:hypothetical protein
MATLATRPRKHWLAKIRWNLASRSSENDNEREPRIGVLHFDSIKEFEWARMTRHRALPDQESQLTGNASSRRDNLAPLKISTDCADQHHYATFARLSCRSGQRKTDNYSHSYNEARSTSLFLKSHSRIGCSPPKSKSENRAATLRLLFV